MHDDDPSTENHPDEHDEQSVNDGPPVGFAYPAAHENADEEAQRPDDGAPVTLVVCPDGQAVQAIAPADE